MRKFILPAIALLGLAGALLLVFRSQPPPRGAKPVVEPPQAPFPAYVAGAGLIESPTTNVSVAAPVAGVVREVFVKVGQQVRAGQPLFQLDDSAKQAELERQKVALALAELKVSKLERGTRPEEVASQEAQVSQARASLEEAQKQLALRQAITDARAISRDDLLQQTSNVRLKEEQLRYAQNQLRLLQAGSWQPDIEIARADIASAQAQIRQTEVDLARLLVRAPIAGEILQVNVHPGELANSTGAGSALILMGDTVHLHVRAEVDENDAWRVEPSRKAVGYPRGRRDVAIPLRFVRIEPYVAGKRNLTGESTERVDTRVLQVVYEFANPPIRLYIGQQMDVFLEADPLPDPGAKPQSKKRS